jgi:hypothetical protein
MIADAQPALVSMMRQAAVHMVDPSADVYTTMCGIELTRCTERPKITPNAERITCAGCDMEHKARLVRIALRGDNEFCPTCGGRGMDEVVGHACWDCEGTGWRPSR